MIIENHTDNISMTIPVTGLTSSRRATMVNIMYKRIWKTKPWATRNQKHRNLFRWS